MESFLFSVSVISKRVQIFREIVSRLEEKTGYDMSEKERTIGF